MDKVDQKPMVLIVDDEPDICDLVSMTLAQMDVDTITAANLTEARSILGKYRLSLCLADMRLPDGDGIDLVHYMQDHFPEIPVAVITAFGNIEGAVNTLKAGAFDYVSKPVNLKVLRDLVNTALRIAELKTSSLSLEKRSLLGSSPAMEELRFKIGRLARSQAPVLICGASGTGKELVAQMIHEQGPRAGAPFVPVNCGAIPSELVESEFFGHKKGSFTGAIANKDGLFQAAQGGTLLLDEVADLPLNMQVKLLRAIQEKAVRPVGSRQEISVDVRILSATHKNLRSLVHNGEFRQDLFYRINVIELRVPGLSDRPEDIFILADYILGQISAHQNIDKPELAKSALDALLAYTFPEAYPRVKNLRVRHFFRENR